MKIPTLHAGRRQAAIDHRALLWSLAAACLCLPAMPVVAEIRFVEVTREAGLEYTGGTYGASWGDFDGDGWPDLWVGNHIDPPRLYLNGRNGRFENITGKAWSSDPHADDHGAAWADFDNDGDQDLIEVVDAERAQYGWLEGAAPDHLFVNESGRLQDRARQWGLDATSGLERTPLWLDADSDGQLDLLITRERRGDKLPSAILWRQGAAFKPSNEVWGFHDAGRSKKEKLYDFLDNLLRLRFHKPHRVDADGTRVFAQLGDLSGDGKPELVAYSRPTRVYELGKPPLREITNSLNFPALDSVQDAAIADFNGDGRMDLYLTRATYWTSQIIQPDPLRLLGHVVRGDNPGQLHVFRFAAEGTVEFEIYPVWMNPAKILLGHDGHQPQTEAPPPGPRLNPHLATYPKVTPDGKPLRWDAYRFTLSPEDSTLAGPVALPPAKEGGMAIEYDRDKKQWVVYTQEVYIDFEIRSQQPIRDLSMEGFVSSAGELHDDLLLNTANGFAAGTIVGGGSACQSVAAGDFDNDMDVDAYLVCTGPAENLPNRLYENDGQGHLTALESAGGAAGSRLGRGDSVVMADYDRDGFLDLFITNGADPVPSPFALDGPYQLFRNAGNANHWLEIDLEGSRSNRDGIGASVTLRTGDVVQIREQSGGMHRFSQHHQRIHFGLGANRKADAVTIRWPSGQLQQLLDVPADQVLRVPEPSS